MPSYSFYQACLINKDPHQAPGTTFKIDAASFPWSSALLFAQLMLLTQVCLLHCSAPFKNCSFRYLRPPVPIRFTPRFAPFGSSALLCAVPHLACTLVGRQSSLSMNCSYLCVLCKSGFASPLQLSCVLCTNGALYQQLSRASSCIIVGVMFAA